MWQIWFLQSAKSPQTQTSFTLENEDKRPSSTSSRLDHVTTKPFWGLSLHSRAAKTNKPSQNANKTVKERLSVIGLPCFSLFSVCKFNRQLCWASSLWPEPRRPAPEGPEPGLPGHGGPEHGGPGSGGPGHRGLGQVGQEPGLLGHGGPGDQQIDDLDQ